MSFRSHRTPSIITVFHDDSALSKRILALVRDRQTKEQSGPEFLADAASAPKESPVQLEILDRRSSPPTPDQMRSIIAYLGHHKDAPSLQKLESGPLVVNWDTGTAATTLEGVQDIIKRAQNEISKEQQTPNEGQSCSIM